MRLALLVETWWLARALHWGREIFILTALAACIVWPNLAHFLGALSLAILCHVGYRGLCFFIIGTARRALNE